MISNLDGADTISGPRCLAISWLLHLDVWLFFFLFASLFVARYCQTDTHTLWVAW